MIGFEKTSTELKAWLESNKLLKVLLPLDIIIMFASLGICFISSFFSGNFFATLGSLAFLVFLAGLILCFANKKLNFLYLGFGGFAAIELISFGYGIIHSIVNMLTTSYFGYRIGFRFSLIDFRMPSLLNVLVFGLIGLFIFMKSGDIAKLKKGATPAEPKIEM